MKFVDENNQTIYINNLDKYLNKNMPWYHFNRELILKGLEDIVIKMIKENLKK